MEQTKEFVSKIELIQKNIEESSIINKKEAFKIIDYYLFKLEEINDDTKLSELYKEIDEYINRWFFMQNDLNKKVIFISNEIKEELRNIINDKNGVNNIENELDYILDSHLKGNKNFYSIFSVYKYILDLKKRLKEYYIEDNKDEELKEVKETKGKKNQLRTIYEEGDFEEVIIEDIIEKQGKREAEIEIDIEKKEQLNQKENINFGYKEVLYDNTIEGLNKKLLILKQLSKEEIKNNNKLFLYIKEKILYLKQKSTNLFYKKIFLLKIIKKYLSKNNEKEIFINTVKDKKENNIDSIINFQENVDSIINITKLLTLNLINSNVNINKILLKFSEEYMGINTYFGLQEKWGIDDRFIVI